MYSESISPGYIREHTAHGQISKLYTYSNFVHVLSFCKNIYYIFSKLYTLYSRTLANVNATLKYIDLEISRKPSLSLHNTQ